MRKYIFSLTLIFFTFYCFGQSKNDSIKYINAIKFIQQDKSVNKYRDKYFFKKANKFRVSTHIISNYNPLRYYSDELLDSLGINKLAVDSLCTLSNDASTIIPFSQKLGVDKKLDYILYFGRPLKNLMLVVIKNNEANDSQDKKYYGVCCRPFIILLAFDTADNVRKAYCSAPIIE